jgi:hypothetical protein
MKDIILIGKLKGRDNLGDLGTDGKEQHKIKMDLTNESV